MSTPKIVVATIVAAGLAFSANAFAGKNKPVGITPKISEVQVFGVPDPKMGEEVCAWVQLQPGEEMTEQELKDYCKDQITHFKIPRYVRFVDDYPMTVTGKIQKFVMREKMTEELAQLQAG